MKEFNCVSLRRSCFLGNRKQDCFYVEQFPFYLNQLLEMVLIGLVVNFWIFPFVLQNLGSRHTFQFLCL